MNFRKIKTNFRRNQKAISPVIATLLMIAIAVVASLVAYAWVMGYMNFTTAKTGKAIQIQSVAYAHGTGDVFTVYVQNVGDSDVQFPANQGVYVNGALANPIVGGGITLTKGSTATFAATASSALTSGVQSVTIKVTTQDGTFTQFTQQFTVP
jgi:archaeal type IV pilus assembly protein PilA